MNEIYSIPDRRLEPPAPIIVGVCHHCRDDIERGDDIVTLDGLMYHLDCFTDCAVNILLDRYGAVKGVAEEDDGYVG